MAAATCEVISDVLTGLLVRWEYDDATLKVSGLRAINPAGSGASFQLVCQVSGQTVSNATIPPGANRLVLLPVVPTLTISQTFKGDTGLQFSIDFIGGGYV